MGFLMTILAAGPLRAKLQAAINSPRLVLIAILANWIMCTIGYMFAESKGVIASLWWTIVTSFTVGYGDLYPHTDSGRLIGIWVMITNYLLLAALLAHILSTFIADKNIFTHEEQEQIKGDLKQILTELAELRAEVSKPAEPQDAPRIPSTVALAWSSTKHD